MAIYKENNESEKAKKKIFSLIDLNSENMVKYLL